MKDRFVYARELFDEFFPEALPMIEKHNSAVEGEPVRLDLNEAAYRQSEKNGGLRIYTVRTPEGKLAAYAVYILAIENHHGKFEGWCDAFFPSPEYRGVGLNLVRYCDRELAKEGIERAYHQVRDSHPNFAELLTHMDYKPVARVFGKDIANGKA